MGSPWPDERQAVLEPLVADARRPLPPADRRRTGSCGSTARRRCTAAPAPLPTEGPKGRKRSAEPIYGDVYLPRKFKIAVAWPGDNSVDVLANDVGLVPTLSDGSTGDVTGYNVFVGGGLGMSHAREDDTYPRLAVPLGWVDARPRRSTSSRRSSRRSATSATATTATGPASSTSSRSAASTGCAPRSSRRLGVAIAAARRAGCRGSPRSYHGTRDGVVGLPVPSGKVADRDGVQPAHGAARAGRRRHWSPRSASRPARTCCCTASRDGRTDLVEDRLRDHGVPAGRRRQRAAPAVDRLPGPADVRSGAGRGRAGAARPRRPSWRRRSPTPATATCRSGST